MKDAQVIYIMRKKRQATVYAGDGHIFVRKPNFTLITVIPSRNRAAVVGELVGNGWIS